MKIKAIYTYHYLEGDEQPEEVLIIGFATNFHIVCLDKYGRLIYANRDELQVIDKEYLDLLKENNNELYEIY